MGGGGGGAQFMGRNSRSMQVDMSQTGYGPSNLNQSSMGGNGGGRGGGAFNCYPSMPSTSPAYGFGGGGMVNSSTYSDNSPNYFAIPSVDQLRGAAFPSVDQLRGAAFATRGGGEPLPSRARGLQVPPPPPPPPDSTGFQQYHLPQQQNMQQQNEYYSNIEQQLQQELHNIRNLKQQYGYGMPTQGGATGLPILASPSQGSFLQPSMQMQGQGRSFPPVSHHSFQQQQQQYAQFGSGPFLTNTTTMSTSTSPGMQSRAP